MTRRTRIPGTHGRTLYVSIGRLIDPHRVGTMRRYTVTRGFGVTLRLFRIGGRYAILTQSFRKAVR